MGSLLFTLIQPFALLLLLSAGAVLVLWRRRKETRRRLLLATLPLLLLLLLCWPPVSFLCLGSLEWQYPPLLERPADIEAIVVLSGSLRQQPGDHYELGVDTLYRTLMGMEMYRHGPPCPLLVSGGKVDPSEPGPTLAGAMREFLVQNGIPDHAILVEDQSTSTWENAVESTRILQQRGFTRVLLVTDGAHLPRAVACFRKLGVEVVPCGCRYRALRLGPFLKTVLPSPGGASGVLEASYEWLALAWYGMRGRI
jgi:uncharacterized SAM-binding protein YcdF (DUF218 family)